jgi:hypothetical protein
MAGFFESFYNPTLFTEDNTTHAGFWTFAPAGFANATNFQQYPPAWAERVANSRILPMLTSPESWGLAGDYAPFGGGGNQHPGTYGSANVYGKVFDSADFNATP